MSFFEVKKRKYISKIHIKKRYVFKDYYLDKFTLARMLENQFISSPC